MWTSSMMMGGKSRKPPFALSGTFATDLEGWAGLNAAWGSTAPRTAPGALEITSNGGGNAEYTIPASVCGGLTISVSIWQRNATTGNTRSLKYKIGSGSFVTLATIGTSGSTYTELAGGFDNPGEYDVTIQIEGSARSYWDDWVISGL